MLLCSASSASATLRDLLFPKGHSSFIVTGQFCCVLKKLKSLKILRVREKHLPRAGQDQDGEDTGLPELETQESNLKSPTYLTLAAFIC